MKTWTGQRAASFADFLLLDNHAPVTAHQGPSDLASVTSVQHESAASVASTKVTAAGAFPLGLKPRMAFASSFLSNSALPPTAFPASVGWFPTSFDDKAGAEAPSHHEAGQPHHHGGSGSGHPRMIDVAGIVVFLAMSTGVGAACKTIFMHRRNVPEENEKKSVSPNIARDLPLSVSELSNETLMLMAEQGVSAACMERLIRHIMNVDGISYDEAHKRQVELDKKAFIMLDMSFWPMYTMIGACALGGLLCFPMVYEKHTAELMNYLFVNSDVPEPGEMNNMWDVGSWSWEWMEPLMGTAATAILFVQLARGVCEDLEIPVYHQRVRIMIGGKLASQYPQYDKDIIKNFVKTLNMSGEETLDGGAG
jgi:hypothetical protein